MDTTRLLEQLKSSFRRLDVVLARCPASRATYPGAIGHWSIKDIVAHLAAHAHRAAVELEAAHQGQAIVEDKGCQEAFKAGAAALGTYLSFEQTLSIWREAHWRVMDTVGALGSIAPDSTLAAYVRESLGMHTYNLYNDYEPKIQAWLDG